MLSDKEFSHLEFDPTVKKKLAQVYPKLGSIFGQFDDRMMRYVILMYDMRSPLRDYYPDLQARKEYAATLAGYDLDKDSVEELFDFKQTITITKDEETETEEVPYDKLLDLITDFMKYQNSYVWTMIVSNEQAFYEFNRRVMIPVDNGKDKDVLQAVDIKKKLMESQDDIVQRLKKYGREMTGDDDKLERVINKRKRISPENINVSGV